MTDLRTRIAAAIQRATGIHAPGAAAVANAIAVEVEAILAHEVAITDESLDAAVRTLIAARWDELARIAQNARGGL